jgi:hypothetical protein
MTNKTVLQSIKAQPIVGANVMAASNELPLITEGYDVATVDQLLARLVGTSADLKAERTAFAAAAVEPVMQIVPYVEMYNRFFMQVSYQQGEDNALPVEDQLSAVAYSSHPQTGIQYVKPGYLFTRPTFSTFTTGIKMPWSTMAKAGWNVLARQMNYAAWEMAKKRDAAAKTVIDAAVPTSHKLTVTGSLTKTSVDQVIRQSNQIGFPVKFAVINPGRLMEMQSWTWGATGFFIPQGVAQQLVDNLYYGNYGGVQWYAHPYASVNTVYLSGDASFLGWHQTKGTPRNDSAIDIDLGVDKYSFRDAEHAWYIQSGLPLWTITIA